MLHLITKNESQQKYLYRTDALRRLAARILDEERAKPHRQPWPHAKTPLELSVLFCDDPFIATLNKEYRNKRGPTDVLSFAQEFEHHGHPEVLGDIVISLETVERFCKGNRGAMRAEVPVPHGERSNHPGEITIACRECAAVEPGPFTYTWRHPRMAGSVGWIGSCVSLMADMTSIARSMMALPLARSNSTPSCSQSTIA